MQSFVHNFSLDVIFNTEGCLRYRPRLVVSNAGQVPWYTLPCILKGASRVFHDGFKLNSEFLFFATLTVAAIVQISILMFQQGLLTACMDLL